MAEIVVSHKPIDNEREQAGFFYARDRSRSFRDLTKGLFKTHDFGIVDAAIDTDLVFPDTAKPVTFSTKIEITGAAPAGMIFEFGSTASAVALGITVAAGLQAVAGDGGVADPAGVDGAVADDIITTLGARLALVFAINPGAGKAVLFINGQVALRLTNSAFTSDEFADNIATTSDGSVASAITGTTSARVTWTDQAPVDFALVEPVRAYIGQLPKHFGS